MDIIELRLSADITIGQANRLLGVLFHHWLENTVLEKILDKEASSGKSHMKIEF